MKLPHFPSGVTVRKQLAGRGATIALRARTVVQGPLQMALDGAQDALTIVMGPGAAATMLLTVAGPKRGEHAIDVSLERGASLTLVLLQRSAGAQKIVERVAVGTGASSHLINVTLGGTSVEHAVHCTVGGAGGRSRIDWAFHARGAQKHALSARNAFHARGGSGEVVIRGVAQEKAQVRCDGLVEIGKKGGGTDAHLEQHILMLDASAKVDAVPALEIKTNDVKAGHGATVTKVSEEDLFYLGSRGIGRDDGRAMIVAGFLDEILSSVTDETLRDHVRAAMER